MDHPLHSKLSLEKGFKKDMHPQQSKKQVKDTHHIMSWLSI